MSKNYRNKKRRGENSSGITTKIRLYPLKKDSDEPTCETSDAKVFVISNESKKGKEDNLIKIEVLFIDKLDLETEQWLSNLIYQQNTIFGRKNYLEREYLMKRTFKNIKTSFKRGR